MQNIRVLITGGAGFLGSHLVDLLVKRGYTVTVVDKNQSSIPGVKSVEGDFCDEELMKPLLQECDGVFHLAAVVGVDFCRNNPDEVQRVNVESTKRFIDLCIDQNIKKFLFTSSSEVYGNSPNVPYKEENDLEPVSVYGQGKVLVEKYLQEKTQGTDVAVGIVRLFNVYGPGQRPNFVVPIFIQKALQNEPIEIFGDGKQTRCFTYVGDVVDGIEKFYQYTDGGFEIVNLGNPQEYAMTQLAELVLQCVPQSTSKIVYKEYGKSDVRNSDLEIQRRVPSAEKAKALIGFVAQTPLEEGLRKIITTLTTA